MTSNKDKRRYPEFMQVLLLHITSRFPQLKRDLALANMEMDPKDFVLKSVSWASVLTAVITALLYMLFITLPVPPMLLIPLVPLVFTSTFLYMMKVPEVRMLRRKRDIDMDIVFAGRQILIELRSGISLFDAILSVTDGYGEVSEEFSKIVEKTTIGISIDVAMREIAETNPSRAFGRITSQLASSVRSGSDITVAFEGILEQVSREQEIELKAYGQKLNPLAMFYMIVGVILPSLGVVLTIIVLSFVSISIGTDVLVMALSIQALLQYIFLTMVESARPRLYA
ncbi:MAG: type II secretion system F family protein [Candidatus Micrarchaeota archaeon]